MDTHHTQGIARAASIAAAAVLCCALLAGADVAHGEGTGDHPSPEPDILTRSEEAARRRAEDDRGGRPRRGGTGDVAAAVTGLAIDEPYCFLWTPSHEQERPYWCGPATVQVIDDYFGPCASQLTIASWLGTDLYGTMFTRVDDALRCFAGQAYYYYGGLSYSQVLSRIEHSLHDHRLPLALDVRISGARWPNYVYDHTGHIVPCEGFSWLNGTVRLNDVYQECRWRMKGGETFGHRVYPSDLVADAVCSHPQRAVVSAP